METPKKPQNRAALMTPLRIPATPQLTRLGYGTGVEVMLVKRSPRVDGRSPWAVKRLNKQVKGKSSKIFEDRIVYEAEILKQLDHPNIVGFRNLIKDKEGRHCLAMEDGQISLGDLLETRFENNEGPFPFPQLKKMALDIAGALKYLHQEVLVLHGDLKSFNVLVKGDIFKLCDFGVCVPIDKDGFIDLKNQPDAMYTGTDLWSAPEVMTREPKLISDKSEMFSFGLLIYEGIALVPPHTLNSPQDTSVISIKDTNEELNETDGENVDFMENCGTRPNLPDELIPEEYNDLIGLFLVCTNALPSERPSASEALKYLTSLDK